MVHDTAADYGPEDADEAVLPAGTADGTRTVTYRHDWSSDDPLSVTVVESVVAARGDDSPPDPPLWNAIDPDGLDRLFRPAGENARTSGRLTFRFAGCEVTVGADGLVRSRHRPPTADEFEDASVQTATEGGQP